MDAEVKKMLTSWSNKQPNWVQYVFAHVLEENKSLSIKNSQEIVDKMIDGESFESIPLNFPDDTNSTEKMKLVVLNNVQNIGAIESDEGIGFSEDEPTVIFGPNGSGKSTYIRILKKMSGTNFGQVLLGNVFKNNNKKQQAQVEYKFGEKTYIKTLNDFTGDPLLRHIQVFDTEISNRYINQGNESSYEPLILSSLKQLIQSMAVVKEQLIEKKKYMLTSNLPDISDERLKIDEDIRRGRKFFDISRIENFSAEDEDKIATLTKMFQTQNLKQRIAALKKNDEIVEQVLNTLASLSRIFNEESVKEIHGLFKSLEENMVFKKNLRKQFFENNSSESSAISSVSENNWSKMWQYACAYISEHEDNNTCVLCGQVLEGNYKEKYDNIISFFNNQINKQIQVIERKISDFKSELPDPNILNNLIEYSCMILEISERDKQIIQEKQTNIYDETSDLNKISMEGYSSLSFLKDFYSNFKVKIHKEIKLLSEKNNAEYITILKNELIALHRKKYFFQNKKTIQQNNVILAKIKRIQNILKETNTSSLTKLIDKIADKLITTKYIDKFNDELSNLMDGRKNAIKVSMIKEPARKGKISLSLKINGRLDVELSSVLSEGEKRIVSLAAFLADSSLGDFNTPLIIDDPITSLDMEFEESVMKRLVELSDERQIIIFTHRLSLVKQVRNLKEGADFIELYTIEENKGIPTRMSFQKISSTNFYNFASGLNEKLKDSDPENYRDSLWKACQDFRKMVEKSIEDILIGGVVSRYNPEIKSLQVNRLGKITPDDCSMIDDMMTKYSNREHSQSDEIPIAEPTRKELEEDIKRFAEWAKEARKRLNNS